MTTETIIANTKQMIDDLKTVCANFGLGNASSEYKIITEIFLYKFLNDKFLYEVQQAEESLYRITGSLCRAQIPGSASGGKRHRPD